MAPHPPKFKAGDLLRHTEGRAHLFIVAVSDLYYETMVLTASVTPYRKTTTVKVIDWAYELAT